MHVHIGLLSAVNVTLMWMIIVFFIRTLAEKYADTPWGQALAKLF